jgi:hypothetical protein
MKKFSTYDFLTKRILSEAGNGPDGFTKGPAQATAPNMSMPPAEETPEQTGQQQKAKGASQNEPFKELSGQTIVSVSFQPNGSTGGIISIKTKNSHLPFKISWVNSKATVQDTSGNVINLTDNV